MPKEAAAVREAKGIKPLISVVVPVFNEEENIGLLHEALSATAASLNDYRWEFVITDNHSSDGTWDRLQALARADGRIRAYRFSRNFGFQRSILSGYRLAHGDAAIQIDCDLQDPPEFIADFLRLWRAGYKVVYGIRKTRRENALLSAGRRVFYKVLNRLSEHDLPPDAGDFRLIDRCIIDILHGYDDEKPYIRGFIATLGFTQVGVEYSRQARERGQSKFSLWKLIDFGLDGIIGYSILPLRLASIVSIFCMISAFLGIAIYVALRFTYGADDWPPGIASILIFILVSTALNAFFFGVVGEYIGRIFLQVKGQALTVVENTSDNARENMTSGMTIGARTAVKNAIVFSLPPEQDGASRAEARASAPEKRVRARTPRTSG